MGKKILFLLCGLVLLSLQYIESKKALKGHCGSKGRKDRWRGCKKRDGSKENPTVTPTNPPTSKETNAPTTDAPTPNPPMRVGNQCCLYSEIVRQGDCMIGAPDATPCGPDAFCTYGYGENACVICNTSTELTNCPIDTS